MTLVPPLRRADQDAAHPEGRRQICAGAAARSAERTNKQHAAEALRDAAKRENGCGRFIKKGSGISGPGAGLDLDRNVTKSAQAAEPPFVGGRR